MSSERRQHINETSSNSNSAIDGGGIGWSDDGGTGCKKSEEEHMYEGDGKTAGQVV